MLILPYLSRKNKIESQLAQGAVVRKKDNF